MKNILLIVTLVCIVSVGTVAHAQSPDELLNTILTSLQNGPVEGEPSAGFARDGVYGCNGASYGTVGRQGPGGAFVPVFSDAEHDQIRLITYKECLLDGIVNSMRETLISFIIKSVVGWANQGFEGNPAYVENLPLHLLERISDPEAERIILGGETNTIPESHRRDVRVALAKYYANKTRRPAQHLTCGATTEQLDAFGKNDSVGLGGWDGFFAVISDPSCNPLFSFYEARNRLDEAVSAENNREQTQLDWAGGFRTSVSEQTINLGDGTSQTVNRIVTPGILISQHIEQLIGTGLRQSESADEIDEIVSALMSNLGTQMLTDLQGLNGLSQSFNGRPAYIDRLSEDSAQRTRDNFLNAGLATVQNAVTYETNYRTARLSAAQTLLTAENQLRTWERTCWDALVAKAKEDLRAQVEATACAGQDAGTCTATGTVSDIIVRDSLGVRVTNNTTIVPYGRTKENGSALSVIASNTDIVVGPTRPAPDTSGLWESTPLDITPVPPGTIAVQATETHGGGVAHTLTANATKEVSTLGTFVRPPVQSPAIIITATADGQTATVTLQPSFARTEAIRAGSMTPLTTILADQVARVEVALRVLAEIQQAVAGTNSASAQRFILERIDQLVANRILHNEAQVRQATEQAEEIEGAMNQLLQETKESWEQGWCKPENWRQSAN